MLKYIARRLLFALPAILAITVVIFLAIRVLPGDVTATIFGDEGMQRISEGDRQRLLKSLNLDKPLYEQYFLWVKDISTLRFGESFWRGDPIVDMIMRRGFISAEIAILALVFSWIVGVPVGILSALKQNSVLEYVARVFTILFLAIPGFWLGLLVVLMLLVVFNWHSLPFIVFPWDDFRENMGIVVWPAIVLGLGQAGFLARLARSACLEVIREDYVRTARAKGLKERVVMFRHVLKNALIPIVTLSGVSMGYLLGGSVAVETAFGVPGLGTALVDGLQQRDYTVVQNLVFLYGVIFVLVNLLVDITYAWIDPRIRYS